MRHALDALFRPRSVVLVGATEKSPWSQLIHANFAKMAYSGEVWLVNRRGAEAHGRPAVTSCKALPTVPDVAYVFVPTDAVLEAVQDLAQAGVKFAVILSSGYAETGEEGARAQSELVAYARDHDVILMGPNSLGYINYANEVPLSPLPVIPGYRSGGVAVVSQSGATTQVIANFAQQQGVDLSFAIATGNEADLDAARVIDFLVNDEATRVIAAFVETIKDPPAFRRAAAVAAAAGKPLVVLKVGRSELASQLAQAHTGSVTGDDAVFDAVCARDNIIRVGSIEELVVTAGVLERAGAVEGGAAIISISGGACEIIADAAATASLDLPAFSPTTRERLEAVVAGYGAVFNPLDVTGAAVRDPSLFGRILAILAEDPALGLLGCVYDLPRDASDFADPDAFRAMGAGLSAARKPAFMINQSVRPVGTYTRAFMTDMGVPAVTGGLDLAVRAFAAAQRWSRGRKGVLFEAAAAKTRAPAPRARPASELQTLDHLEAQGAPVIARTLARTPDEAVDAWRRMGESVVLKVASADILHKTELGGVRLDLDGEAEVREAFDAILARARTARPDAAIDGCLVMPMRRGGVELFVGATRSPWGTVIAAGLGGIWIEALNDISLRLAPISAGEAREMLLSLRGRRILEGYRGRPAVDLEAVAVAIQAIGDAALALGPDLVTLEVNPLLAHGGGVEALDALAIWN